MRDSLPEQLYLLGCRLDAERLPDRHRVGLVVRAGALTELLRYGRLTDEYGAPRIRDERPVGDPLLDGILGELLVSGRWSWRRWIDLHWSQTLAAVQERLRADGVITVRRRPLLADRIAVADRQAVELLRRRVVAVLGGAANVPADAASPGVSGEAAAPGPGGEGAHAEVGVTLALAALSGAGELRTVLSRRERWAYRGRIRELIGQVGPPARALRKEIVLLNAARGGA
ncbi:GPP34 family phosphoprotein [Micromonospora sp. NPDC049559]|uniref:GOLPH3/VPS74 family protein n=1 Tax=Micromonospora sp. NPDC049559 TaxID=3155923 RepID=UPI003417519B